MPKNNSPPRRIYYYSHPPSIAHDHTVYSIPAPDYRGSVFFLALYSAIPYNENSQKGD